MFYTLSNAEITIYATFYLSSANALNFVKSKMFFLVIELTVKTDVKTFDFFILNRLQKTKMCLKIMGLASERVEKVRKGRNAVFKST